MNDGLDRYGRQLAVCHVWEVYNLNAQMVHEGWALAYRRYTDHYGSNERGARAGQAGMWRGRFVPPWEWRKRRRGL